MDTYNIDYETILDIKYVYGVDILSALNKLNIQYVNKLHQYKINIPYPVYQALYCYIESNKYAQMELDEYLYKTICSNTLGMGTA